MHASARSLASMTGCQYADFTKGEQAVWNHVKGIFFNLATGRPQWLALHLQAPDLLSAGIASSPTCCAKCFTVRKRFNLYSCCHKIEKSTHLQTFLEITASTIRMKPSCLESEGMCRWSSLLRKTFFRGFSQHSPTYKIFLHSVTQRHRSLFNNQNKRRGNACFQSSCFCCFFWVFHTEPLQQQPVGRWLSDYHKGLDQPPAHTFEFLSTGAVENQSFFKSFFFLSIGDKQKEGFGEKKKHEEEERKNNRRSFLCSAESLNPLTGFKQSKSQCDL